MKINLGFRSWFYLRVGWSTYFALIFTAINTLTVTYYLAIEKVPTLHEVFPSFLIYVGVMVSIGLPILVLVGWVHFRRSHAYGSEAEVTTESNPYFYKAAPGWSRDVMWPLFLSLSEMLIKISKNEKLTEEELKEMTKIQEKIKKLMQGESIGHPRNRPN